MRIQDLLLQPRHCGKPEQASSNDGVGYRDVDAPGAVSPCRPAASGPAGDRRRGLDAFRDRLGRSAFTANQELIAALTELDDCWSPFRPVSGGALHDIRLGHLHDGRLASCPCNEQSMRSPEFQQWVRAMGEQPDHLHRKNWEWAYVAQALQEREMLREGRRGLGFAVGQEPLSSLFAAQGCEILATDVSSDQAAQAGWIRTGQHASSLANLHKPDLVSEDVFRKKVSFHPADMRNVPDDLGGFDFHWSACAFEHLGTLEAGKEFVWRSYELLASGGVAVHTTEYNMDSDWMTVGSGNDVLFRRADLEEIAEGVRRRGGRVTLDFREGDLPADRHVDRPPYRGNPHLRLEIFGYRCTSFGLVLEKP